MELTRLLDDAGKKNRVQDQAKECDKNGQEKDVRDQEEVLRKQFKQEFERLFGQGEAANNNSTNRRNTISSSVNVVSSSLLLWIQEAKEPKGMSLKVCLDKTRMLMAIVSTRWSLSLVLLDPLMIILVTGIFNGAYDDEVESKVADFNNMELTIVVSPIPTTRIHKDHPKEQIIGDPLSAPKTRRMTKSSQEHAMVSYIKKQRRTNHMDYQNCLFACFLSQIEPKKATQALTDPSWIEAMHDELLQFRFQKVWRLVDLPKGKHVIETKWVYRNKKDERGIVVRNKARLMDVKSAFLYVTIEEEVYVCQPPTVPKSSKDAVANRARKKTNEEPANEAELDNCLFQPESKVMRIALTEFLLFSLSVSVAGKSFTNADDLPTDPLMPDLKDTANLLNTGIFSGAYDDENVGAKAVLTTWNSP
ncbi:hypothetical protein Tco_0614754 [Tanacetum coccineum]